MSHTFEKTHPEDLATVIQILVKMTDRPPEEIKLHLDTMLSHLTETQERPFSETATPEEWIRALQEWASSHRRKTPLLSNEAVSRRGIYSEDGE